MVRLGGKVDNHVRFAAGIFCPRRAVGPSALCQVLEVRVAIWMTIAKMPRLGRVVKMHDLWRMNDVQFVLHCCRHSLAKLWLPEVCLHIPHRWELQPAACKHSV